EHQLSRAEQLRVEAALKKRAVELRKLEGGMIEIIQNGYEVPQNRNRRCDGSQGIWCDKWFPEIPPFIEVVSLRVPPCLCRISHWPRCTSREQVVAEEILGHLVPSWMLRASALLAEPGTTTSLEGD